MLKGLLYILILGDVVVLLARNLALRSFHLDRLQAEELARFNWMGTAVLVLAVVFLLGVYLFTPRRVKTPDQWPMTPPE